MDDITPRMSSEKLLPRSDTDDGSCEVPEWPLKNTSWVALRVMVTGGLLVTASLLLNITLLAMLHRARSNSHKVETSLAKPMLYCSYPPRLVNPKANTPKPPPTTCSRQSSSNSTAASTTV